AAGSESQARRGRRSFVERRGLHPASAALAGPVEREHLNAVARRLGDGRAEKRAGLHGHLAWHPDGRAADDSARGVDALDLQANPLSRLARPVVEVAFDRRALAVLDHLKLDLKIAIRGLRNV